MPPSQRIAIPGQYQQATTLREMCAAAEALKGYDTPQALPFLGQFTAKAPTRAGMLVGFPLRTLLMLVYWAALLAALAAVAYVEYTVYGGLIAPFLAESRPWQIGAVALVAALSLWLIVTHPKAREKLRLAVGTGEVKLNPLWRGILGVARLLTQATMLVAMLLGVVGLAIPMLYAAREGWAFVNRLPPAQVGPFAPLQQYLGLDPVITLGPTAAFIAAGILIALLAWKARMVLAAGFWAAGLILLYLEFEAGRLDVIALALLAAPAFLWPLRVPYGFANLTRWGYRRWTAQVERLLLGWELRNSLSAAFAAHRKRNRERVDKDGSRAVCRRDLAFFTERQAGPVSYWVCPECEDDDAVYPHVRLVRGILDVGMAANYTQEGDTLLVNLRAWQAASAPLPAPPLQEVRFGCLGDTHEPEMFIAQYHSVQAQRKYPPLSRVSAVIAAESGLDESARRQIAGSMRVV